MAHHKRRRRRRGGIKGCCWMCSGYLRNQRRPTLQELRSALDQAEQVADTLTRAVEQSGSSTGS